MAGTRKTTKSTGVVQNNTVDKSVYDAKVKDLESKILLIVTILII